MKIIQNLENYKPYKPSIITIGTFDGLHIGHQKIISDLVHISKKEKLVSVVLTFFPHPRMVLQDKNIKMIDTIEEKQKFLKNLGVDFLIVHPFSNDFSRLSAIDFVRDILVNKLNISKIIVGYDHRFGRNREATISDLKNFGEAYNFSTNIVPAQEILKITVSSTKIRSAIIEGKIKTANKYLGRPFILTGKVIKGNSIGRTLGFPTANIKIDEDYKIRPAKGVYLIQCFIQDKMFFGMMNFGKRPTLEGKENRLEVHFFSLEKDLYNLKLKIELLEKIRSEKKFDSLESLKEQLMLDQNRCKKIVSNKLKN
ncbi:MAG: bifunctional riboflavin kinase/FAD synthetase [Bacteroidota bacterium]|nr:bifunctional riboflavin kinase/FAD synthetase [Bacteroidota bacterium]